MFWRNYIYQGSSHCLQDSSRPGFFIQTLIVFCFDILYTVNILQYRDSDQKVINFAVFMVVVIGFFCGILPKLSIWRGRGGTHSFRSTEYLTNNKQLASAQNSSFSSSEEYLQNLQQKDSELQLVRLFRSHQPTSQHLLFLLIQVQFRL